MRVEGTQIVLSAEGIERRKEDTGLWFNRYRDYLSSWGIKVSWIRGISYRPVGRIYWLHGWPNPWKTDKYWFIVGPKRVGRPFFSVVFGRHKFYIGWKVYELDTKDDIWNDKHQPYGQYLCPSIRG